MLAVAILLVLYNLLYKGRCIDALRMKVVDVLQVGEQSVLAGTKSLRRQRLQFIAVQLLLVTLATMHHVT